MPDVTVYSREHCHLCDDAIETIRTVAEEVSMPVEIDVVDVDEDPSLREEYGERVPYVLIDDRPAFKYRVDADEFRSTLAERG
ncbi:glutaredoxin family protein [Halorientalis salina]|uniref:glutaredoxin family protein n=1 Tax=Halorientalis salina TaxID=2932266 RepID=UPI0010AC5198|nr:glutaredoxin family protein [Halorientalis salina]